MPIINFLFYTVENYTKGETIECDGDENISTLFPNLPEDFIHMKVKYGSKMNNLIGYAIKQFKEDKYSHILFSGAKNATSKTITCSEILKRKFKLQNIQQVTKISYRRIEEIWEPKLPELDRLKVVREIPAIYILLSKIPLDSSEPGFQAAGVSSCFWKTHPARHTKKSSNKAGSLKRQRESQKEEPN